MKQKFYTNAFYNANDTDQRCECGAIMRHGICQNYGHDSDNFRTIDELRNMKTPLTLPEAIASGQFVIVGYGETYQCQILEGRQLYPTMMEWMFGPEWGKDATREQKDAYWQDLCDLDGHWWSCCGDVPAAMWSTDVGETDHIEIRRITTA